MNAHDVSNQLRDEYGKWTDDGIPNKESSNKSTATSKPTKEEITSVKEYTDSKYAGINRYLRKGINPTEDKINSIENIENFIAKSPKMANAESYRGLQLELGEYLKLLSKAKPGSILLDKGFVSTTTHPEYAENFAGVNPYSGKVIMKIVGNSGVSLSKGFTTMEDEGEILYNHGTKFKVLEAIETNVSGRAVLKLKLKAM